MTLYVPTRIRPICFKSGISRDDLRENKDICVCPNPVWLVPYRKGRLGQTKGRPGEDSERKWPQTSQGKRPPKEPSLQTP